MDDRLGDVIQLVRQALEADPLGVVIGELRPPNPSVEIPEGPLSGYFEFLSLCDGARCGVIDLWSYRELPESQFRIAHLGDETTKWLCIGQLLYDPLAINRETGEIRLFRHDPPPDFEGRSLGVAEEFIDRDVFGPGYRRLVPDPDADRWCTFLGLLGLLNGT